MGKIVTYLKQVWEALKNLCKYGYVGKITINLYPDDSIETIQSIIDRVDKTIPRFVACEFSFNKKELSRSAEKKPTFESFDGGGCLFVSNAVLYN